ncbi:MAG: hypothetical protein NC093_02585 [Alistipes sp.]|nr:hypothetical protein [Alistipes sp.]
MDMTPVVAAGGTVADALTDVTTLFTSAVNMITGSPLAMAFVGIALAGAGIGLFSRVIHAGG